MRTLFQIVTILVIPIIALLALELILFLAGVQTTYDVEDPFLGFQTSLSLYEKKISTASKEIYATRKNKLEWFNHQEFLAQKPAAGYRVFCFGGSTTFGHPYFYKTAFSNWLQVLLTELMPDRSVEVINAGGISYASYRIVNLMKEMVNYSPDLFIVYSGHNEFLEDRTYGEIKSTAPAVMKIRSQLNRLRTYSLVRKVWLRTQHQRQQQAHTKFQMTGEVKPILDQAAGLDRYQRNPEYQDAVLHHYRYNLQQMISLARERGIEIIFVAPPSNIKDFSPFKSELTNISQVADWQQLYQNGLAYLSSRDYRAALKAFQQAAALDSSHADLRYRTGKCLFALGQFPQAKHEFIKANDLDVAPLRATSFIQNNVREVCAEQKVPLLDLPQFLEAQCLKRYQHTILGREFFLDHAHPTIEVHQQVAELLAQLLIDLKYIEIQKSWETIEKQALYDQVLQTIDTMYYAMRDLNLAKVLDWAGKYEEAMPFMLHAAESLPDHPEALFLRGLVYMDQGKFQLAADDFLKAVTIDPANYRALNALGSVYEKTNNLDAAINCLERSIQVNPEYDIAYYNLGNTVYRLGQIPRAIEAYEQALRINPNHSKAMNNLGAIYLNTGDLVKARQCFENTLKLNPQNYNSYSNLGIIFYRNGDLQMAQTMLEKAQAINPADPFSKSWLMRIKEERSLHGKK